jgi:predicted glycoside hydrolase/deacetylase ChbG (UPF0249 family)
MLIINADDFGRNSLATDRIIDCYSSGRLGSTSAMVFMADSERAAKLLESSKLDAGLHLNFTEPFSAPCVGTKLREHQNRIANFLNGSRFASLIFHPLLRNEFHYVFESQVAEFVRIYGGQPSHYDGHHHMHLCANVLLGGLIPKGAKVRRSFSFKTGEKSFLNRSYRSMVDRWILGRFLTTDLLFSLPQCVAAGGLERVFKLAAGENVELECHPESSTDLEILLSSAFFGLVSSARQGNYRDIRGRAFLEENSSALSKGSIH